ncbi:MAG: MATE family efflux transporter [Burkholderiales bacterium]|nr:MATE family efflux transporter [Burkholderiales bacterium]
MIDTTRKTLVQLCLPLLLNSALGLVTTLIDTMIISAYSKNAAGSVSIANQILVVAYDFSVLLGVGAVILITHAIGRGDERPAREIASIAILANTAISVLIAVLLAIAGPSLVTYINTPPELVDDAVLYIYVIAIAIPFNGFLMASVACLRGFARTRTILVLGLFAFPAYLVVDYVLVLGAGPIPALGVLGSALATLIVRTAAVVMLLFVLNRMVGVSWRLPRPLRRVHDRVVELVKLSYPSVLDNVSYGFYQLVLVSFIAGFGVTAVLSRFYVMALTAFLAVIIMAISQGNEVLVGYRFGAGRHDDMHRRALQSSAASVTLATVLSIVAFLCSDVLVDLFTSDPDIHAQVRELLYLTIFIQPLSGLNTVLFHSLRVVGDVYAPVVFSQLVMWCGAMPLAYVFAVVLECGVAGLWYALILEEAVKALYMVYRWSRRAGNGGRHLPRPVAVVAPRP